MSCYLFFFFSHGVIAFPTSCFLGLLTRRLLSKCNRNAMTSHVCALQNASLHSVCIVHLLLLFSRPLDSPTQNILRCLLAEYLSAARLNKPLTAVCGAMLSASRGPNLGGFSYHFLFHNLPVGILVLCGSCCGNKVLSQRKILLYLDQIRWVDLPNFPPPTVIIKKLYLINKGLKDTAKT